MASPIYQYTAEEIQNNYEFKVVRRIMMKEFPWIKNVIVDPTSLDIYNPIFLDVDIDPELFAKTYGYTLSPMVNKVIEQGKEYATMYLSLFLVQTAYEDTVFITNKIRDLINKIRHSPVIPDELKLKGRRNMVIGDWYINRGATPWNTSRIY
jgi:hypothetical protein